MKPLTILLEDEVYHRLEVLCAKKDEKLSEGLAGWLNDLVVDYEERRGKWPVSNADLTATV